MRDLISRQAAIDDIWTVSPLAHLDREWIDRWLRQLPPANTSEFPNNSDTISRQAAIDVLDEIEAEVADGYGYQYAKWREYFAEMPPAQPERIKGRWIEKPHVHGVAYCSLCDYELHTNDTNFCPNCGAEMGVTE